MSLAPFTDGAVPMAALRARAHNQRWADLPDDVIALTAADSDFPVSPAVRLAVTAFAASGLYPYGPAEGAADFREACARLMTVDRRAPTSPGEVLAVDSAAAGMLHVARTILGPGDEALVFDPVDFLFAAAVEAAGARPVRVPIDPATGRFDPDVVESLVTPRTRMLGLCNPHNPLGRVWHRDELEVLGEIVLRHGLAVLNDEVWADIVLAPHRFTSFAALGPEVAGRTWTVGGFSKSHGLAGLRVGFVAAPGPAAFEALAEASRCRTTMTGTSTIAQVAAVAALDRGRDHLARYVDHLARMRDLVVARLATVPGVALRPPEGTFVAFPDVSALGAPADEVARVLLERHRVAVVPGTQRWFGPGAAGHLRLAFSTSEGVLTEGLDRITAGLASWEPPGRGWG